MRNVSVWYRVVRRCAAATDIPSAVQRRYEIVLIMRYRKAIHEYALELIKIGA